MVHNRRVLLLVVVAVLMLGSFATGTPISASSAFAGLPRIVVSACRNGLKITVSNLRSGSGQTELKITNVGRAVDNSANIYLPSSDPIPYKTFSNSQYVAGSGNIAFSVSATEYVYFDQEQSNGTEIVANIDTFYNGAATGQGVRTSSIVHGCFQPSLRGPTLDLSGAIQKGYPDGRAQPSPADTMAVYCIVTGSYAGTIVVDGYGQGGSYRGNEFKQNYVASVYPAGVSRPAFDGHGTIVVRGNGSKYRAEWINGLWGPYQVKEFNCTFDKSKYNKNSNQLTYPTGFGSDGRVDPNAAEHFAVYCETKGSLAGTIRVVGIDANGQGYALGSFKYSEVVKNSPNPITVNAQVGPGTVSLRVDLDDNFFLEWQGSQWNYQSKAFKCRF